MATLVSCNSPVSAAHILMVGEPLISAFPRSTCCASADKCSRTMSGAMPSKVTTASAPFDDASTADIIFRTSDCIHFYAHKLILSIASTWFKRLFTIAPSPASGDHQDMLLGIPVFDVVEDSMTLDCILRYCYPVRDPIVQSLELLDRVLRAAIKYALDQATLLATARLRTFVMDSPLHVYAISSRHGLHQEMQLAAAKWKKRNRYRGKNVSFSDSCASVCYDTTMHDLPAGAYYRLMEYMATQGDGAAKLCQPLSVVLNVPAELGLDSYPFDQPSADIVLISKDGTKFSVHRAFIEMQIAANPVFPLQSMLISPTPDGLGDDGKPFYLTQAEPVVLSRLLRLCYPATNNNGISQWDDERCCSATTVRTLSAALHYGMIPIVDAYRARMQAGIAKRPLDVYCISITFGWHGEAYSAAKYMARHIVLPYAVSPWIDALSAQQYHLILRFWYDCQDAMALATSRLFPFRFFDDPLWSDTWYAYEGTHEARRNPTAPQKVLAEAMDGGPCMSTASSQVSTLVSTYPRSEGQGAELQRFLQRSVELEAKFEEAIASVRLTPLTGLECSLFSKVDFRLC